MCRYLVTSRQHGASELQPWAAAAVASRAGPWVDTTPPQPAGSRSSSSWSSCSSWSPAPAAGSPGPSGGSRSCPGVRPRQTEVGLQCLHSAVTVIVLGQVTVTQHLTTWHCVVTSVIGIVTCDMWCVMWRYDGRVRLQYLEETRKQRSKYICFAPSLQLENQHLFLFKPLRCDVVSLFWPSQFSSVTN